MTRRRPPRAVAVVDEFDDVERDRGGDAHRGAVLVLGLRRGGPAAGAAAWCGWTRCRACRCDFVLASLPVESLPPAVSPGAPCGARLGLGRWWSTCRRPSSTPPPAPTVTPARDDVDRRGRRSSARTRWWRRASRPRPPRSRRRPSSSPWPSGRRSPVMAPPTARPGPPRMQAAVRTLWIAMLATPVSDAVEPPPAPPMVSVWRRRQPSRHGERAMPVGVAPAAMPAKTAVRMRLRATEAPTPTELPLSPRPTASPSPWPCSCGCRAR